MLKIPSRRARRLLPAIVMCVLAVSSLPSAKAQQQGKSGPVTVDIRDEKTTRVEPILPIAPGKFISITQQTNLAMRIRVDNKTLHLGYIYSHFKIDNQLHSVPRAQIYRKKLPNTASGKSRDGYYSVARLNNIEVKQTVEVVPGRSKGETQRRLDNALVTYEIKNLGTVKHKFGMRVRLDMYLVSNDGALFAAPNFPNKVLDGVDLKGKDVPRYLQVLQRPELKNPGYVAHFTYGLGSNWEKPDRVILTGLRARPLDNWIYQAIKANGDSAMYMYWDIEDLAPKATRKFAYAYGKGIASGIGNEGNMLVKLGGNFAPGKTFTIKTYVYDPVPGQALTLDLPRGMKRVEGPFVQPVPIINAAGKSLVLWKARVTEPGEYRLRIHSSTGETTTKIITVRLKENEAG